MVVPGIVTGRWSPALAQGQRSIRTVRTLTRTHMLRGVVHCSLSTASKHHTKTKTASPAKVFHMASPAKVFHMCPVAHWDAAKDLGQAYFPPTFEQDGNFTHGSAGPAAAMLATCNHFYKTGAQWEGKWVVLQLDRDFLRSVCGIVTKDEAPAAVGGTAGEKDEKDEKASSDSKPKPKVLFPHIYGGIPTHAVEKEYAMTRAGEGDASGEFTGIEGLD